MTTYYFATDGDDLNDGLSENTPMQTLQKATALSAMLLPADQLLLKGGDLFYGALLPQASGTRKDPIRFGIYGDNGNAVIDGSEKIDEEWILHKEKYPHVWRAAWTPQDGDPLRRLFLDGEAANPREEVLGDVNSSGDWFYDAIENCILLYSKSKSPDKAFSEIRGSSVAKCIYIGGPINIIIDGINCTRANENCLKATGGSYNIEIRNLILSFGGYSGYLQTKEASNTRLINVKSIKHGLNIFDHGFYMGTSGDHGRFYMEDPEASENSGYGIHVYQSSVGGEIVRPKGGGNGKRDITVDDAKGSVRITL